MQSVTRPATLPPIAGPSWAVDAFAAVIGLATMLDVLALGVAVFVDRVSDAATRPAIAASEVTSSYTVGA